MSWSLAVVGTPEAIVKELESFVPCGGTQSVDEYNAVKPALVALVSQNVNKELLQLSANGQATVNSDGVKTYSACRVELKGLPGKLVTLAEGPAAGG